MIHKKVFMSSLTVNENFKINNQEIYMNANIGREELIVNNVLKNFIFHINREIFNIIFIIYNSNEFII